MTWQTYQLTALVNLLICGAIGWACICRLNSELCRLYKRPRARYSALLAGAVASGAQPILFGTMPGPGETIFAGSVLIYLLLNLELWFAGKPYDTQH